MANSLSIEKCEIGKLSIVLHAHLPYVKSNEINSLEEDWFFQATLECYMPLLKEIEYASKINNSSTKLTLSISPTLSSMLVNKSLKERFPLWIESRLKILKEDSKINQNNKNFLLNKLKETIDEWNSCQGDLIKRFRDLNKSGNLDLMTCAATHGYLPILRQNKEAVIGQIKTAVREHNRIFKIKPYGIWLPECAYYEDLDLILNEAGIRYAVLDGHGILNANPRPRYGVYAPICSKNGVAFFGRDTNSTLPVWSAREGYPGDCSYREFHKDLGWELSLNKLKEYGIPSQRPLGLKLHKITNQSSPLGEKDFYNPSEANQKANEHAIRYLKERKVQINKIISTAGICPSLIAPFDAELFGHWWYEGPVFLREIFKHSSKYNILLTNLKEVLSKEPNLQVCNPSPSSWGKGGFHNYWLNETNSWVVPEITKAGEVFINECSKELIDNEKLKILNQAGRELLLSQSSDWSFILKAGTTTDLAKDRIKKHLNRFWVLLNSIKLNKKLDNKFFKFISEEDNLFPTINIKDWAKN
tara:strand:- start:3562 stop:5151 length:1590 start_codon:yes stop_codon:yes gene_type:complete